MASFRIQVKRFTIENYYFVSEHFPDLNKFMVTEVCEESIYINDMKGLYEISGSYGSEYKNDFSFGMLSRAVS
jgi:hypothetical protein